jgi:hypothetical protein
VVERGGADAVRGVPWGELSEQQRLGMTREFWESLTPEQQSALVERNCVYADGRPRVPGGVYCDHHTALLQSGYRSGED